MDKISPLQTCPRDIRITISEPPRLLRYLEDSGKKIFLYNDMAKVDLHEDGRTDGITNDSVPHGDGTGM